MIFEDKWELHLTKADRKALRGSIRKWENIVGRVEVDRYADNCPLCNLYPVSCERCPVMIYSGQSECRHTPWTKWHQHQRKEHGVFISPARCQCPTCTKLAKEEVKFLKHLLRIGK